jgi:TRAP-type mannitol/chloroaromatic compound transport system substrate-binding protein
MKSTAKRRRPIPISRKVLEVMQAFRNEEYLWWQVAEYSYDTFMIRSRARV